MNNELESLKNDVHMADAVIEAYDEELAISTKENQILQEQLENAKDIMQKMVEALDDFLSIAKRRNSEPMYGRDARNIGVEDGYSFAPQDYDYEEAQSKARSACYEAFEAGLIKELPYEFR
jgi:hypothetical protein